jgi:hypothetical protein
LFKSIHPVKYIFSDDGEGSSFEKKINAMESNDLTLQQLMFSLIQVWKKSGKKQLEFCREKDIAYSKFQYWMKKYKDQSRIVGDNDFVPVVVKDQPKMGGSMELLFPDGRKLIFYQAVEASYLRALLGS